MPDDNFAAVRLCCWKPGTKSVRAEPEAALISSRKCTEQNRTNNNNKHKQRA